jgi:hypothetical protein
MYARGAHTGSRRGGKKRGEGCKSYGEVAQLVRAQDS